MATIPIKRVILYKHGVGYWERRGAFAGTSLQLQFAREAMDDVLKSLIALDLGAGQVLGIDFETPEDRAARLARGSIHLSDTRSLLDLLRDLRGRRVRLLFGPDTSDEQRETGASKSPVEGLIVGVDIDDEEALRRPLVTIYQDDDRRLSTFAIRDLAGVELVDADAAADLSYFLRAAQSEEDRRSATIHLSPGEHTLLVGYIAPAPAWRVSYRMLFDREDRSADGFVLLQGWGLFDNQLEEDLDGVELSLVAGMPVSFRYRLYEPHTPERPFVEDEERTVSTPLFFESAPSLADASPAPMMAMARSARGVAGAGPSFKTADVAESVQAAASGEERGALFAYNVAHPVSVARGQSAMVPILSQRLACKRDLLYNGQKLPTNPIASLRLVNETGLTLERGPATVLEQGDYAGEAVLPFTRTGGDLIVPFAVELGITVNEQQRSERQLAGISVRDTYFLFQEYDVQQRVYDITSTLSEAATVMVEHPLLPGYELWQGRAPDESTATVARWNVVCAPHARTVFTVYERQMQTRSEQVRGTTGARLHTFLRDKFLDQATFDALEHVLELYRQADAAQERVNALGQERQQIYAQQKQIQGSLGPLGTEGDEGALRQRYVATLNQVEDRLAAFAEEEARLKNLMAAWEQEASERLHQLASPVS